MAGRNRRKHSYTLSLAASLVLVVSAWAAGVIQKGENGIIINIPRNIEEVQAVSDHAGSEAEIPETEEIPMAVAPVVEDDSLGEAYEEETTEPVMYEADSCYFDDALFIGDSRTVGLHEYGDLGNAEVVADAGMNVYKIYETEFATISGEKKLLETILSERQFGKIYLMLGINELGYDYDRTVSRYEELVKKLQESQPDALIFLQANLHITGKKSEASPIYTNENINRFNQAVEQMADQRTRFYLDVNELFDDENGNLAQEYTMDNAHVLGKYYSDWVEWILKHAR